MSRAQDAADMLIETARSLDLNGPELTQEVLDQIQDKVREIDELVHQGCSLVGRGLRGIGRMALAKLLG